MKFTYVNGDTWVGLYGDGKLLSEGHSIRIDELADLFNVDLEVQFADLDWLDSEGSFPEDLKDVELE